eukprot:356644-Chlamydomonas_euryale.AAC.2
MHMGSVPHTPQTHSRSNQSCEMRWRCTTLRIVGTNIAKSCAEQGAARHGTAGMRRRLVWRWWAVGGKGGRSGTASKRGPSSCRRAQVRRGARHGAVKTRASVGGGRNSYRWVDGKLSVGGQSAIGRWTVSYWWVDGRHVRVSAAHPHIRTSTGTSTNQQPLGSWQASRMASRMANHTCLT